MPTLKTNLPSLGGVAGNFWAIVLAANFIPVVIQAQTSDLLTLDEAITTALAENRDLKVLGYDREISRNSIDPALAGIGPRIEVQGNAYFGYGDTRVTTINLGPPTGEDPEPLALDGIRHGLLVQPEANWLVYDGGAGQLRLEQLRLVDQATALQIDAVREQTVAAVTNTYLGAAQLSQQLTLAAENIDLSNERLARTERDARYGTANSLRRLQAQVDLNTDSAAYRNLDLQFGNAKRRLNLLLARDPETPFTLEPARPLTEFVLIYDSLRTDLLANNENLAQAQMRITQSERALELSNTVFKPNVQLYGNLNYLNTTDNANFLQENRNFGAEAGVRVSYLLYDGGARRIEAQNAKLRTERNRANRSELEAELLTLLRQAYASYRNALEQLTTEKVNLPTFQLNYDKTLADYRLGQVDATTLRTAQVNLNAAKTRITLQEFAVRETEVELYRLTGRLVD